MKRADVPQGKKTLVIGLTGGAGSGKSQVAEIFRQNGARVVEADRLGHRLLRRGSQYYSKIVKAFGPGILGRRGTVDRRRLGDLVFSGSRKRTRLNRIVHPELVRQIRARIAGNKRTGSRPVVVDAALLVDWGLHGEMDHLIVVDAPAGLRLKRLEAKGVSRQKAKGIMAAQMPAGRLKRLADIVIDNSGTKNDLRRKAAAVWRKIRSDLGN
jgi:dephospho-CoA kinase